MSNNKKMFLAGLPWSALVLAVLWASDPMAHSPAVVFSVVVIVLGWLAVISLFGSSSASASYQAVNFRHVDEWEVIQQTSDVMLRTSTAFATQIGEIRADVSRTQNILSEAVVRLVNSFREMNEHVQRQRHLGVEVISGENEANSASEFQRFASKTSETLRQFVDSAVENSRLGMGLVEMTGRIQDVVNQLLGHVDRRLDLLDEVLGDEQRLVTAMRDTGDTQVTVRMLDALREHVDQLSDKIAAMKLGADNNPVSQTGYASGDVELF